MNKMEFSKLFDDKETSRKVSPKLKKTKWPETEWT